MRALLIALTLAATTVHAEGIYETCRFDEDCRTMRHDDRVCDLGICMQPVLAEGTDLQGEIENHACVMFVSTCPAGWDIERWGESWFWLCLKNEKSKAKMQRAERHERECYRGIKP